MADIISNFFGGDVLLREYICAKQLNSAGDLYIADEGNYVIRKVTNIGMMSAAQKKKEKVEVKLYPDPASEFLKVEVKDLIETQLFNILGKEVISSVEKALNVCTLENGIYLARIKTKEGVVTQKVMVHH